MSDLPDNDLLAAEYVLGTLEGDERRQAERLLATDPAFSRSVAVWQQRLTPLAAQVALAAPPADLWGRIEANILPSATADILPFRRRVRFWQGTTAAALAIAASLAAFIVLHQPEPQRVAVLSPMSGGAPVLMATAERNGALIVQPTASIQVPTDKDLELWALPKGETKPRSLGVFPPSGRQLTAELAPDTQLLVSLEPKGGSPTGQPTGPVLYGGLADDNPVAARLRGTRDRAQNLQERLRPAPEYSRAPGEARIAFVPSGCLIMLRPLPRGVEMTSSTAYVALNRRRGVPGLFVRATACPMLDNRPAHFAGQKPSAPVV